MFQVTALYKHPQNPTAFDEHYQEVHVPLVKKLLGIKGFTTIKPTSLNPQEASPYYLIANLYFEDMGTLQTTLQSPEGQAVMSDVPNFATGGVSLVGGEVQVYDPVLIG
jgi:uncharacterized protein (TIGR02118 family)